MILIAPTLLLLFFAIESSASYSYLTNDSIDLCSSDALDYNNYTTLNLDDCGCEICVRKCCRSGYYYSHNGNSDDGSLISGCMKGDSINFSVPLYDIDKKVRHLYDRFVVGILECYNQEVIEFNLDNDDTKHYFFIQEDGALYYPHSKKIDNDTDYCVDTRNGTTTYFFCIELASSKLLIHVAAKIIPVPFLLATFLVFVILPDRTIHRKALIFHTSCLIPGNILLAVSQYHIIENKILCVASGYIIFYCMSTSYFWMNVMCVDIWLAFSGVRGFTGRLGRENIFFIILSVYAWGMPGLIILVVAFLDFFGDSSRDYWPGMGTESCFLRDLPSFIFYFGPTIVLILFNCTLFILTTINIQKTKREAAIIEGADSSKHNRRKDEKFTLYWNLLFVMGINPIVNSHLVQLISWTAGWKGNINFSIYLFYYKDFAHAMYGIVIFAIFVGKKKIWRELKQRYYQFTGVLKENESSTSTNISNKSASEVASSDLRLTNFKKKET